jgi:Tfp pilus assembly protein PilO
MKLSSREKILAMATGGIVFVLLNLLLVSAFARRNTALRSDLAQQRLEWVTMQQLLAEQALWASRDAALTARQPGLTNENAAGVELLDSIRTLAKNHSVTLENPVFEGVVRSQWYRSVPVSLDTHSSWPDLIGFLYALQKPDQFIVCEAANIQVDPSDQAKMLGHFKIARWYSPL